MQDKQKEASGASTAAPIDRTCLSSSLGNSEACPLSTESSRDTVNSQTSNWHQSHAVVVGRTEVQPEELSWHHRTYTAADFDKLQELLKEEDEEFLPNEKVLEDFRAYSLNRPVGTIRNYIKSGKTPPADWVERSLLYSLGVWLDRYPWSAAQESSGSQ